VDRLAFLGDLVGYGPDPGAVVDLIAAAEGAVVVKGNHDEALEVEPKNRISMASLTTRWSGRARRWRRSSGGSWRGCRWWTRTGDVCFVHSSAQPPERWEYVEDAAAAQRSMDAAGTPYVLVERDHEGSRSFNLLARPTVSTPTTDISRGCRRRGNDWQWVN